MVIHELPGGGTADLDLRGEGGVSGLGVYNLRFTSDVVSPVILMANGGLIHAVVGLRVIQVPVDDTRPLILGYHLRSPNLSRADYTRLLAP